MFVNQVNGTSQVYFQDAAAAPQSPANSAENSSALPEDTVTLSPAAQAMQTEQKVLAAETRPSPGGEDAALWVSALMLTTE